MVGAGGVFVTGTGTEVGKTVVAAAIARTAAASGRRVRVFKPAVSGLDEHQGGGDNGTLPDHALLRLAAGSGQSDEEIAPHRYGPPVSPHLGAELADEKIDPQGLLESARAATRNGEFLVCEGVGGFLVPLTSSYLVRDFARDLGLPVVVAAPPHLGTINHTLLTAEAVRGAGLGIAAVVLTPWSQEPSPVELSNRDTIAELAGVRTLTLPHLDLTRLDAWPSLEI